jgi:cell division septal protein FtsQ
MRYNPQKHRKSQRRTRFDVSVPERARSLLPQMTFVQPKLVIGLLVCLILIGAAVWFNGPAWRITDIQVVNNDGIPADQIVGASGLQNEHYQFVSLEDAAKRIDELPGVQAAEVSCQWLFKTSCRIVVQPAKPLAMWASARGNVWTDYEGKVQRAPEQMTTQILIRVAEGEPPPIGVPLDESVLRALVEIATSQPTLSRLEYSQEFGLMMKDARGARVRLGGASFDGELIAKLRLANELSEQLNQQGVAPRVIDVRFVNAPFYMR